jgi:integrase
MGPRRLATFLALADEQRPSHLLTSSRRIATVPYALRHTFASLSIAAGVTLFELSRFMGTSPTMLDKTYGHLLPDTLDRGRTALDSFLAAEPPRRLGTEWAPCRPAKTKPA